MNELVKEWFKKGFADAATAHREFGVAQEPNYDAVCFHAQQAVEKAFKGLLQHKEIAFPKTHDLGLLLELMPSDYYPLRDFKEGAFRLTVFAVEFRYPGESAVMMDAETAVQAMERILQCVVQLFPHALTAAPVKFMGDGRLRQ